MRRDEMVEAVEYLVMSYRDTDATSKEIADMIVTEVELRGMLPPSIPEEGQPLHPENSFVNVWEADNE